MIGWFLTWIRIWMYRLSLLFVPPPERQQHQHQHQPPIVTPDEMYMTPRHAQFQRKFSSTLSDANVNNEFSLPYAEYWKHVCDKDNALEKQWRQRLLFESTPRGLVVMFYDPFKRGFAYYSDTNMPYTILNTVAMKYVATFQCRAFFIDDAYFPEGHTSPILVLDEHDANTNTNKTKHNNTLKGGPFLKRSNSNSSNSNSNSSSNSSSSVDTAPTRIANGTKERRKNRFLSLGKVVNCKLLLSPSSSLPQIPTQTQTQQFDYKFWKSRQENEPQTASQVFTQMMMTAHE